MRLLRVATVNIKDLAAELHRWHANFGEIDVRTRGFFSDEEQSILVVTAETKLSERPSVNNDEQVVVPIEACRELEAAIELIANALSITQHARRVVSSAAPCVALIAESDDERRWLSKRSSFAYPTHAPAATLPHVTAKCDVLEMLPKLMDRQDGVALLSEAISDEHASGRFKEFIRFFERAFRATSTALVDPLTSYLSPAPYGYTTEEIRNWLIDVRHPLTHADKKRDFLVEADVRPLLPRVEQAAYDTLLNKEVWRSKDTSRRQIWIPDAFNTPTGAVIRQHSTPTVHGQMFDGLGVYPLNLKAKITNPPRDWWHGFPSSSSRDQPP